MVNKSFEHTIQFYQIQTNTGDILWIPIVTVFLVQPNGNRLQLPLIFDTGADITTLRHDLYPLLGLTSWDTGERVEIGTAGGPDPVIVYKHRTILEFLGKVIDCDIHLARLPHNPMYVGLLGRAQIFKEFGFGFWESDHALYVTKFP